MDRSISDINAIIRQHAPLFTSIKTEVSKVIVGQNTMVERAIIAILTNGHLLIEGVPGLAKTLLCSTLAQVIDSQFNRIQFTPDLLPSDLTGNTVYRKETDEIYVKKGPLFANLVLADEINRAPAKVQSALLEAMQERQITIGDNTYPLPKPFLVVATQNPIDQEGTYRLPEAQVDRFMMKVNITYPTVSEEKSILERMTSPTQVTPLKVITAANIMNAQDAIQHVYLDDRIKNYIVAIVCATRNPENYGLKDLRHYVEYGASPRATIALATAAKALAFIDGRSFVIPDDILEVGMDILRHRVSLNYEAEAESFSVEDFLTQLFKTVQIP